MTDRAREFHRLFLELRIEDQLRYYEARRREYAAAHRQAIVLRTALLLAAGAAGVVGQAMGGTARAGWAVAGALLAALAAAVTAFETLIGFPQLEKLYRDAARNLDEARVDWEDVDPEVVPEAEVERAEDVFRSERGQWGQLVVKSAPPAPAATPPPGPAATPPPAPPAPKPPASPPAPG